PPYHLIADDFLVGNPGVQASNLFIRLSTILEAGCFDESLQSCTDRDLCIRLSQLPDLKYGIVKRPTVLHYADSSRPRLSNPMSPERKAGLDAFYLKYRHMMSEDQHQRFLERAYRYFG
ncbi:MAG: hypothetical protein QXZ09_09895, partial [Candidatus Methanomethylicaceae archaeon]